MHEKGSKAKILQQTIKLEEAQSAVAALGLHFDSLLANPDMTFFIICVLIFLGSLLSGAVPFMLNLSDKHMSLLAAFGAGLLISTALAIILPEGIDAFSEAKEHSGGPAQNNSVESTFSTCPMNILAVYSSSGHFTGAC